MSRQLSEEQVTLFTQEVHHEFQSPGKDIRELVRVKDAKGAKIVKFPKMGAGITQERTSIHTPLPIANIDHDPKSATIKRYTISDMVDIFDASEVNFDERQELVKSFTKSLRRRMDQIVIDCLVAASISKTVADTISGTADDWTLAAVKKVAGLLDLDEVDEEERAILLHSTGVHHLNDSTVITSSDHNNMKPLVSGNLDFFYGFNFKKIGNRGEGGLPAPSANHRTSFGFQKSAVGLAVNLEPEIEINYIPLYGAWMVTGYLSAGGVVIDEKGVVEVTTDETSS